MSPIVRTRILAALGDATLILTVAAALPYSMGDMADVLGPRTKVYVSAFSLGVAGLAKFTQHAIQIISAWTSPTTPPLTQEQVAQVAEQVMNAPLPAVQTVRITVPQSPFAPTAKSAILPDQKP